MNVCPPGAHPAEGLNSRQRRYAELRIREPERERWRIALEAGYLDVPDDAEVDSDLKKRLHHAASRAERSRNVQAYMQHLRELAAKAALADPNAIKMRDQIRAMHVAEWDAVTVGAITFDLAVRKAHFDPNDVLEVEGGKLSLRDWEGLAPEQRQMISSVKFADPCPKCGTGRDGLDLKFENRLGYLKLLGSWLGAEKPSRVEVTGKDGAPLGLPSSERGLTPGTVLAVRRLIIGAPVEPVEGQP